MNRWLIASVTLALWAVASSCAHSGAPARSGAPYRCDPRQERCYVVDLAGAGTDALADAARLRAVATDGALAVIAKRLRSMGLDDVRLRKFGDFGVLVQFPAGPPSPKLDELLVRPAALAFRLEDSSDAGRGLFGAARETIESFNASHVGTAPITIDVDRRDSSSYARADIPPGSLGADVPASLAAFVAGIKVPAGRIVGYEVVKAGDSGEDGRAGYVRTRVLLAEPVLTGAHVTTVTPVRSEALRNPELEIFLDAEGAAKMEDATGRNVGSVLAIQLDDEVIVAPVVVDRIAGGRVKLSLGRGQSPIESAQESEVLRALLVSGSLPAILRRVDTLGHRD